MRCSTGSSSMSVFLLYSATREGGACCSSAVNFRPRNPGREGLLAPRPLVPPDRSEFERSAALLSGEEHRRWLERPYLFIFHVIDVIVAFVAVERVRSRRGGVPFYMMADFRLGVGHSGHLVLALHDPVLDHDRGSRGAALRLRFHVLGRGHLRLRLYAALHGDRLQRLSGQGPANHRPLLKTDEEGVSQ